MSFIEKWANKWCPKAIRVFFVPMLCFGIGFPVALVVLGPLGYNIGALLTTVILALYNTLGWLAVALLAAVLPFMISMGMHKALYPVRELLLFLTPALKCCTCPLLWHTTFPRAVPAWALL